MSGAFEANLYENLRNGCQCSASVIVPLLTADYHPGTVLDVGCGEGWFADAFRIVGVDATGIDGSRPPFSPLPEESFIVADLSVPGHGWPTVDLVLCLEVAEHLPPDRAESLIDDLCAAAPIVVFAAAIPGQGGYGHINEQWPSYWAGLFGNHGMYPDTALRETIWNDERVEAWYRQNLLVFSEVGERIPDRRPVNLDVVHPLIFGWRVQERNELLRGRR